MIDRGAERNTPALIAKHRAQLGVRWKWEVIYIAAMLVSVDRSRLVAAKIPFIVPGKQLYLQMVGIDFRELFSRPGPKPTNLSPAAQILVLATLYTHDPELKRPTVLAKEFGYSKMTMGWALDELEALGLAERRSRGKERRTAFLELWETLWHTARTVM